MVRAKRRMDQETTRETRYLLLRENLCLRCPKPTFVLKTASIGSWISLFVTMNHEFGNGMPTKIWLFYVTLASIC